MVLISKHLEDYEVISILGATINSTYYKVKNKTTSELYMWKAVSCEKLSQLERLSLIKKINERKQLHNPYVLRMYDFIMHEETDILYLITEFCKNGSLNNVVLNCLRCDEYVNEDFIWQMLYQLACGMKIKTKLYSNTNLENIFLDDSNKVKFYDFDDLTVTQDNSDSTSVSVLRDLVYSLCVLQPHNLNNPKFPREGNALEIPSYYSESLNNIIEFMFNGNMGVKPTIDSILCHPKVLMKSAIKTNTIYIKNNKTHRLRLSHRDLKQNATNCKVEHANKLQLENIKNREVALRIRENKFIEKEYELSKRYKKIAQLENQLVEKFLQVDQYLKKVQESIAVSEGTGVFNVNYVDTGGAVNVVNREQSLKSSNFTRTISERRVRFKGHSPLKNISNKHLYSPIKNVYKKPLNDKEKRHSKLFCTDEEKALAEMTLNDTTVVENPSLLNSSAVKRTEKYIPRNKIKRKERFFSALISKHKKHVKAPAVVSELQDDENSWEDVASACTPISWTKETKQHAFDLLRIMNNETNKENIETSVKHTSL